MASQTIPLLSEILKWENTWEKIWKLLFFSTIGSFLGSVLTSSVLFPTFGVYLSSVLNSIILSSLALILSFYLIKNHKKIFISSILWTLVFVLSLAIFINWEKLKEWFIFKTANSYHDIEIFENDEKRLFLMNKWFSSGIDKNTKESFFGYIKEIKKNILKNISSENPKKILIIWAAWFTLPQELAKEKNISKIDVVDIDKSLKDIAEKYFLQEKLDEKITFIPDSARFFLNNSIKNKNFYDVIVLDIYIGKSLPAETITKEFFEQIKKSWKIVYLNLITDKNLETNFSKKIFNTLENVFWEMYYLPEIYENMENKNHLTNIVVTNQKTENYLKYEKNNDLWIYTDDKHSIENDLFINDLNNF